MSDPIPPYTYAFPEASQPVYFISRPRPRYWLHALLLLLTFFTTLAVGARFQYNFVHHLPTLDLNDSSGLPFPLMWVLRAPQRLLLGLPFSLSLMGILLAHEMGHYLYCRKYHVYATLPYFLPAPTLIGTLGAFIRIKSPIRTREALFDIGIGGPIAGFVVALPLLFLGLALSHGGNRDDMSFGYPLIFNFAHAFCGPALPLDKLQLHPVAIAAWFGMFATALNLLPGGQLDGGHIIASVWPRAHRIISIITVVALLYISWSFFVGWVLWALFLLIAIRHPHVPEYPKLNAPRLWIALLGMIMLAITIAPRPFSAAENGQGLSLNEIIQQFRHGG